MPAILFIASLHGVAREGTAQQLTPQTRYSTHDWTAPVGFSGESIDYREFWADVKTPGDGFAYSVGTIEVQNTLPGALFSQQSALDLGSLHRLLTVRSHGWDCHLLSLDRGEGGCPDRDSPEATQ